MNSAEGISPRSGCRERSRASTRSRAASGSARPTRKSRIGGTGHTEAIEVRYDPSRVNYGELLEVFWHNIDPLNPVRYEFYKYSCGRGKRLEELWGSP